MGNGSTKERREGTAGEVSFTPFGEDPLADAIRRRVRDIIEHTVEEELDAALGAGSYARVTERRGYRHGHQERRLGTTVGPVGLTLPRARLFAAAGGTQEWHPQAVRRYRRRMVAVDNAVIGTFLAGVNQRRLRGALRPLLRDVPLSKSAVSRLVTRLRTGWEEWRTRALAEERCVYLYLDGFGVKVRCGGRVVRMTVLAAVGVRPDGQKCLLALDLAASESAEAWRGLLEGLVARGLRPPMLCIVDGSPGLGQALGAVWRDVAVQRCMVHKLRNLLAKAPQHAHDALRDDFHAIMYAESAAAAEAAYQRFVARWAKRCQRVVESLEEAGAELLTVFRLTPAAQWKCLRSTNVIERMHEEFRRRIKTQASLPTEDAVLVLLFALMASGQLRLRRIDGWRELGAVMDRVLRPAA